jgi:hypothetical protein
MGRLVIVPGLAVRSFVVPAAEALEAAGHQVELLPAPGWRGVPDRLADYGEWLADRLRRRRTRVDILTGLSAGTQAAAVAAVGYPVGRLLLVSPTVSPERRSRGRLLASWLHGDHHPDSPTLGQQAPDWARAGPRRIYRCLVSALDLPLEQVLPEVAAPVTIVHAGWDNLTRYDFVTRLAVEHADPVVELPAAPHSWPIGDEGRFVSVVNELLARDAQARPVR